MAVNIQGNLEKGGGDQCLIDIYGQNIVVLKSEKNHTKLLCERMFENLSDGNGAMDHADNTADGNVGQPNMYLDT